MHHCVARRVSASLEGSAVLCHATVHGEPFTIEVRRTHNGWTLSDMRGFANTRPDDRTWNRLEPWFLAHDMTAAR